VHSPRKRRRGAPATAGVETRIAVVLAPGLGGWLAPLAAALDERFAVSVGAPADRGIAVLDVREPAELRTLRRGHPGVLVVVLLANRHDEARIAALFDAGADVVLSSPDVRMVAAHIRALIRRHITAPPDR
jgi:DNA-binding response OmpR family regulator